MVIKEPLKIDYEQESVEDIVEKLQFAIEQHPSLLKVISEEEYAKQEAELNEKRKFWNFSNYDWSTRWFDKASLFLNKYWIKNLFDIKNIDKFAIYYQY